MTLADQLLFVPRLGSINVTIAGGTYTFYAVKMGTKVTTVSASGGTFDEGAQRLIDKLTK